MRSVKDKDIVIKTPSGLYLIILENGQVGITNKRHASHFNGRAKAKRAMRRSGYVELEWADLNKKKRTEQ